MHLSRVALMRMLLVLVGGGPVTSQSGQVAERGRVRLLSCSEGRSLVGVLRVLGMLLWGAVAIHQPIWVGDDLLLVVGSVEVLRWEGGRLTRHGVGMRTHGLRVGRVGNYMGMWMGSMGMG